MMMMMMIGPNYVRPAEASNLRNGGSALCSKLSLDLFRFMDAFRRAKRKDTFKAFLRMWDRRKVPQTLRPYLSPSILSVEDCEDLVPESQQRTGKPAVSQRTGDVGRKISTLEERFQQDHGVPWSNKAWLSSPYPQTKWGLSCWNPAMMLPKAMI